GRHQHFHGGDAAGTISAAHQAVADDGAQHRRELQANLLLLGRRENGNDTVDGFGGGQRLQGREHQVAGFRGGQGRSNWFQVAHFGDQDGVRVLTETGAQRRSKRRSVYFHLALVDESLLVAVQKFDRVFDGDNVLGAAAVDAVNHGGQGG